MPISHATLRGHNEVGEVIAGPTDSPWGRTQEEGVELQVSVQSVDLFSAQSTMDEDAGITRTSLSLVVRLLSGTLLTIRRALGIPSAQLTGDLAAATPTTEVLAIKAGNIGFEEKHLYSIGAGPASTRRIAASRCMLTDMGPLQQSKTGWVLPVATWRILDPTVNFATPLAVLTITDAP